MIHSSLLINEKKFLFKFFFFYLFIVSDNKINSFKRKLFGGYMNRTPGFFVFGIGVGSILNKKKTNFFSENRVSIKNSHDIMKRNISIAVNLVRISAPI